MFGIGSTELLIILLVALIVLGPKCLAGVSRSLGRAMGEFRKVSNDFQRTLNVEAAQEETREKMKKRASQTNSAAQESSLGANTEASAENAPGEMKEKNPPENPEKASPLEAAVARAHAEAAQSDVNAHKTNG